MENISDFMQQNIPVGDNDSSNQERVKNSNTPSAFSDAVVEIISKSAEKKFDLSNGNIYEEPELLVLPSNQHYFYAEEDLKNVRTLINLNKFNNIKHPVNFLHTLFRTLPANAGFIGCFSDDKTRTSLGATYYKPSRLIKWMVNFIDSRTDHFMDRRKVSELLSAHGFKVVEMRNIDGLTFFYSKNMRQSA
jgi:hypothetical protein